ncbi:Hypothetical protein Y17_0765 [Pectobacterium wasabiae CFBP 3304]|nr:Hypothetical protein Y17_0765 [Pectobacterium wasabiae CFBP 3304]
MITDARKRVLRMWGGFAQWNGQFPPVYPLVRIMYIMLNKINALRITIAKPDLSTK